MTMQQATRMNGWRGFGPLIEEFNGIEALNAYYQAHGWDCRYRQIGKGPLRVEVVSRVSGNLTFATASISQRLWGHARSADGAICFVVSLSDAEIVVNGLRVDQGRLLIIPPSASMDIVQGQGAYPLAIQFPADIYESQYAKIGGNEAAPGIGKSVIIDVGREYLEPFRQLALEALRENPKQEDVSALDDTVVEELVRLVVKHKSGILTRDPYGRLRKHDNILRVIEFMHEHLAQNVSIETICRDCGTSPSTLERRFRDFLGVTPKQYILAARLNRARRDLLDPVMFDLSIAEVAMRYHLLHMGRFSQNYKELFGRLPSEERDIAMNHG